MKQILLVDDSTSFIDYVKYIFIDEQYEIKTSTNGLTALEEIKNNKFGLVLLDIQLSDISGLEVLSEIRNHFSQLQLPVIVISSTHNEEVINKALEIGANDFISKPFEKISFKIKVRNLLQLQEIYETQQENFNSLKRYQEQLQRAFDNSPLMTFIVNKELRVTKANKTALEFIEDEQYEGKLLGGEILNCINVTEEPSQCGNLSECSDCALRSYVLRTFESKNGIYKEECKVTLKKNGEICNYWFVISTSLLEYDNETSVLLRIDDITERKKVELELRESEKKYRLLAENINDVIWIYNFTQNKFLYVSPSVEQLRGVTVEEAMKETMADTLPPEQFAYVQQLISEYLAKYVQDPLTNDKGQLEVQQYHKNGNLIWVEIDARFHIDENNEIIIQGVSRNIERRKKDEQKLKDYASKLERMNAEKDLLISILGHDLKNSFSSIIGFSELLLGRKNNISREELNLYLLSIHQASTQTLNLLDDIIKWAKEQTGKLLFNPECFNLYNLISEVIENLQSFVSLKNILIDISCNKNLNLYGDLNMIKVIIRNLINNAIKYSNSGQKVTVSVEDKKEEVVISVVDNGIGLNKEQLQTLWSGNSQHSLGTWLEKGTGLGLWLCKTFVDKHDGDIFVESIPGKETKFCVKLPKKQNDCL